MNGKVKEIIKYPHKRLTKQERGFIRLFISKRLLQGAAMAILGIFVPIFIYENTGMQFYIVGLYYAFLSISYVVLLPPAMKITNRLGFSHTLVLGGIFYILTYSLMYLAAEQSLWIYLPFLTMAIIGLRLFHWVPYHVDFALFTSKGARGRQLSLSMATIAFMGVIGPILAGFIISEAGYDALFATAVALLVAATISYAYVPETRTKFTWTARQTWKKLFSRDNRGIMVGEFANGAETAVNLIVWPIFLYVILDGDVFEIGAVSTFVVGATIILQLLLGKYLDSPLHSKEKTLRAGSALYALGWIFKIFVLSTAQVFFVGLYHNIVKIFTSTPFGTIIYDTTAEQGRYADEFTVIREMSQHSGRALSLIIIAGLSLLIPIEWTFIIAAVASIALNAVYRVHHS